MPANIPVLKGVKICQTSEMRMVIIEGIREDEGPRGYPGRAEEKILRGRQKAGAAEMAVRQEPDIMQKAAGQIIRVQEAVWRTVRVPKDPTDLQIAMQIQRTLPPVRGEPETMRIRLTEALRRTDMHVLPRRGAQAILPHSPVEAALPHRAVQEELLPSVSHSRDVPRKEGSQPPRRPAPARAEHRRAVIIPGLEAGCRRLSI